MGIIERTRHALRRDPSEAAAEGDHPAEALRRLILELETTRFELEQSRRWLGALGEDLDRRTGANERKISRQEREIRAALSSESEESARALMRDKRELIEIGDELTAQRATVNQRLAIVEDSLHQLSEGIRTAKSHHRQLKILAAEQAEPARASTRRLSPEEEPVRRL